MARVSRNQIILRSRVLAPWLLGSGLIIALGLAALDWNYRQGRGPFHHAILAALLIGIAIGTVLAYLRVPDLGIQPGSRFETSRIPGAASPQTYRRALATYGRSTLWLGVCLNALVLLLTEMIPPTNWSIVVPASILNLNNLALGAFIAVLEILSTYAIIWGIQLLAISRTRVPSCSDVD